METIQKRRILWRLPLIVAFICAVYWSVKYLIVGNIPDLTVIKLGPEMNINLPFSRWWDIPVSALYMLVFIVVLTSKKIKDVEDDFATIVIFFPIIILILSVILGFWTGFTFSFLSAVIISFVFEIIFGLVSILWKSATFLFGFKFWPKIGKWIIGLEDLKDEDEE